MSSTLFWEPAKRKKQALDDDLKLVLRIRHGAGSSVNAVLDRTDLEYLRGLKDAGLANAKILIDAIEKHGSITISEKW